VATEHRLRPILLTAAAAILGMIPIAPTVFWGPMAYAVIGGLMVATLLTLVFLPALYVAWFRIQPAQSMSARCNSDRDSESEVAKIVSRLKTISASEAISAPEPALHEP
jgi:predicted RND superfamily exporter protein